jgi:hypothetical protein
VWESGGLWNEIVWRRSPQIEQMNLRILDKGEKLWLYRVEDAVIMVEVKPDNSSLADSTIGQVVLKRLMTAEQAIDLLCETGAFSEEKMLNSESFQ